jgi:nitrite reductase (NO-forming)
LEEQMTSSIRIQPESSIGKVMRCVPLIACAVLVGCVGKASVPQPPRTGVADPSELPPVPAGAVVKVDLTLLDRTVEITPDVKYQAWTFNGTTPGPVIHARVGQTIEVTLTNKAGTGHSIDFHSALAPPSVSYQTIFPGQSIHFSWVAKYPGVFLYHCGTPPVLMHIANGMYGAVVVDPERGWPGGDMRSYVLVQSEFYTQPVAGHPKLFTGNLDKMRAATPDYVAFNGRPTRYLDKPLPIPVNQPVRVFVVDAGPSHFSAFHVVGTIFEKAFTDGNPDNELHGLQTMSIAPGEGGMVQFTVQKPSQYPFLTHSFGDADLGAMGAFSAK